MGTANHPDPAIVLIEESATVADKEFLDAKLAGQMRGDGNSDWSFRGSPGMNNTVQCEELPHPIHGPYKAAYPEYVSHPLGSNNFLTLKSDRERLENTGEHLPGRSHQNAQR